MDIVSLTIEFYSLLEGCGILGASLAGYWRMEEIFWMLRVWRSGYAHGRSYHRRSGLGVNFRQTIEADIRWWGDEWWVGTIYVKTKKCTEVRGEHYRWNQNVNNENREERQEMKVARCRMKYSNRKLKAARLSRILSPPSLNHSILFHPSLSYPTSNDQSSAHSPNNHQNS